MNLVAFSTKVSLSQAQTNNFPILTILRYFHSTPVCHYHPSPLRQFHSTPARLKPKSSFVRKSNFLDHLRIFVRGGGGGQGLKKITGVGGKGGDVYFVGQTNSTFVQIKKKGLNYKAGVGSDASKRRVLGDAGEDVMIPVPLGVSVSDDHGNLIGDINKEGAQLLVATGAVGGGPRNDFIGKRGSGVHVRVDLKLLADVGLVGFPNAGKSTLLSKISRTSPKIAAYPFTTLEPRIGLIEFTDLRQISVADLPGLVEGAHANFGLGHRFLKHVERTKVLLFVVDINGFKFKAASKARSPLETALALMKELELFNEDLVHRKALMCVNKADEDVDDKLVERVVDEMRNIQEVVDDLDVDPSVVPKTILKFDRVRAISAATGVHVDELIGDLRCAVDEEAAKLAAAQLDEEERDYRIDDYTFHLTERRKTTIV